MSTIVTLKTTTLMLPNLSQNGTNSLFDYEFVSHVVTRFFKIMFRSNKKIILIYSEYYSKDLIDKDLYILKFKFRNALWYELKKQRKTKGEFQIYRDGSLDNVDIIVQGFFRKKNFKMNLSQSTSHAINDVRTRFSY